MHDSGIPVRRLMADDGEGGRPVVRRLGWLFQGRSQGRVRGLLTGVVCGGVLGCQGAGRGGEVAAVLHVSVDGELVERLLHR